MKLGPTGEYATEFDLQHGTKQRDRLKTFGGLGLVFAAGCMCACLAAPTLALVASRGKVEFTAGNFPNPIVLNGQFNYGFMLRYSNDALDHGVFLSVVPDGEVNDILITARVFQEGGVAPSELSVFFQRWLLDEHENEIAAYWPNGK